MKHLQENKRKQMLHFHYYYSEAKCNAGSLFLFGKRRIFF